MFLGLVGAAPPAVYRALAGKVAISTTLFLLMIELVGIAMLKFFGISLPVMQVSGGLVLAAMGWSLLSQNEPEPKDAQTGVVDGQILGSLERRIFYPSTFPITAGPGCMVVMVTLSAHASAKGMLPDIAAHAGDCACGCVVERSCVLLLWLRTHNHGACVFRVGPQHASRDRFRLAVHRRTDHMEWSSSPAENCAEIISASPA